MFEKRKKESEEEATVIFESGEEPQVRIKRERESQRLVSSRELFPQ